MRNLLFKTRNSVFGLVIALSFPVLGLSAHWAKLTAGDFFSFEGIGIAASALTILVVATFLIVGIIRKNAVITIIGIELPALVILSTLFLAEGIITSDLAAETFPAGCSPIIFNSFGIQICKEFMAIKGASFAIFGIMTAYWLPLLIMTVISLTQGRNTFGQSVREVKFSSQVTSQANLLAGVIMGEVGIKDSTGGMEYDQGQQQQLQLQQIQLQQLQQQQAMLQQQYMVQQKV